MFLFVPRIRFAMLGGGADIILFVSQLKGVDADVILTGEMSHHAVRLMKYVQSYSRKVVHLRQGV